MVLNRYNGTFPSTFVETGLQWFGFHFECLQKILMAILRDAPNAWPPHQYIVLKALQGLPAYVSQGNLPQQASTFSLVPNNQLGMSESDLPPQPISKTVNASTTGSAADIHKGSGTVWNGGNATSGEGWSKTLQRELANRYFTSALCSWWVFFSSVGNMPGD